MRVSGRVVGWGGALECRSESLGRSDKRPTGGADEREEEVPADEKRVYIAYTPSNPFYALNILIYLNDYWTKSSLLR